MGEVLRNLLSNAVKFTPKGGSVQVRVTVNDVGGLRRQSSLMSMFSSSAKIGADKRVGTVGDGGGYHSPHSADNNEIEKDVTGEGEDRTQDREVLLRIEVMDTGAGISKVSLHECGEGFDRPNLADGRDYCPLRILVRPRLFVDVIRGPISTLLSYFTRNQ